MPKTKIPAEYISDNPSLSGTDSVKVPAGTTAQRGTGVAGKFRFNTTLNKFEGYTDSWGEIGGSGGSALETDNFTGDGSTTAFTLSSTVSDEDNLIVFIDGVYQNKADYVASGTTLTLDTAPVSGRKIVVYHVRANVSGSNCILNSFSGNGSTTAFTLTQNPASENNTQVFIDGVYQRKSSYAVSGTTLTFDAAPGNGTAIEVMMFTQTDINTLPASFVSGLTEVTAVGADHMMIFDATDSALKKALVSDVIEGTTGISSSADATAITIDSSEQVGINNTSPNSFSANARNLVVGSGSGNNGITINSATDGQSRIMFADGTSGGALFDGFIFYDHASQLMSFGTGATGTQSLNINSLGHVGIGSTSFPSWSGDLLKAGTKSLYGQLDINGAAYVINNLAFDGSNWKYVTSDTGSLYSQDPTFDNAHLWYTAADGTAGATATLTERMRLSPDGELAVGVSSVGTSILSYDRDIGAPNWGLNITENTTFNDNSGHTFTSKQNTHGYIYIKDEGGNNGFATIPFFPNAGGGVAYGWNALDPDSATWTTGTVTFTLGGTSGLAFTVAFASGSGQITITRTSGSQLYRVVFSELAQQ